MNFKFIVVILLITLFVWVLYWPETASSERADIDFIRGNNAIFDQKYDLAREFYLADLQVNPNRLDSLNNLSATFIKGNGQSITEAIKYTQRLLQHPDMVDKVDMALLKNAEKLGMTQVIDYLKDSLESNVLLAQLWFSSDIKKAQHHITSVPIEGHDINYYQLSAQIHLALGDFEQSLRDINQAIALETFDSNIYFIKSQTLLRMRQVEKAQKAVQIYQIVKSFEKNMTPQQRLDKLQSAFVLDQGLKDNTKFRVPYVVALIEIGQHNQALKVFNSLERSKIQSIDKIAMLSSAVKYHANKVIESSFDHSSLNSVSPGEAILYCQSLGDDLLDTAELVDYCRQAVERHPLIAPLHFWYGMALLANNDSDLAIEQLALAIDYSPWVDEWRIHLAQVYLTEGKTESAIKVLDESISGNTVLMAQFKKKNGL